MLRAHLNARSDVIDADSDLSQSNSDSRKSEMVWQFTVGLRFNNKADRIVVDAEDALIAALKVKAERPEATIMYVRRSNRRGDTRHPAHTLTEPRQP